MGVHTRSPELVSCFDWFHVFSGGPTEIRTLDSCVQGRRVPADTISPYERCVRDSNPRLLIDNQEGYPYPNAAKHRHHHHQACSFLLFGLGFGAGDRRRTRNPLITNQVLCQLSYTS